MKVAYICNFSYPFWEGVWNNVYHLSKYMIKKGHEVHVFSSNLNPSGESFSDYDVFEGIHIHRFPVKQKIGSYGLFFDFEKEIMKIGPDIIHANVYRNPCAHKALKIAKKLKKPCFLTTHAPFDRKRNFLASIFVKFYDVFYSKSLNSYKKIFYISKWEFPFLLKLKCKREKMYYAPNGVDKEFFIKLDKKKKKQIVYLGRISKIKNLEILIKAAKIFPYLSFKIIGPMEKGYQIKSESKNLEIINKKFDMKEEINFFKNIDIYILPSKSEGFPQTLLEAMAAGKIVIASSTKGAKEVVKSGANGFIFHDFSDLVKKIKNCTEHYEDLLIIRKNAQKTAKDFIWTKIIGSIEKIYHAII